MTSTCHIKGLLLIIMREEKIKKLKVSVRMHALFQFDFSFGLFVVVTFQFVLYGGLLCGEQIVKQLF